MVDKNQIEIFKNRYCNENKVIIELIRDTVDKYFIEPILDVGCGMGDISYHSLFNKVVIGIDLLDFSEYPMAEKHKRMVINFHNYIPLQKINTIFFSHSLQFLDSKVEKLNKKLSSISPKNIITITNRNNDVLGNILSFLDEEKIRHNAEVRVTEFAQGYKLVKTIPFISQLVCPNFEILIEQINYLFILNEVTNMKKLNDYLRTLLNTPQVQINQQIEIYSYV